MEYREWYRTQDSIYPLARTLAFFSYAHRAEALLQVRIRGHRLVTFLILVLEYPDTPGTLPASSRRCEFECLRSCRSSRVGIPTSLRLKLAGFV
eukprot:1212967-Rhodomonas_salina.1